MLADKFNTLQMGIVAAERVFSLLDSEENAEVNGHFKADKISGDVIFKDVKFAYNDQDYVLKGVNFHAKQNETLAIVGSTGSGKTTIISLLNRFYDIQKGSITINGVDIKEWDIPTLRSKIAVVLQDVFLFSGTVIDNITMRDPNISRQQAIDAAILVGADAFIKKLPETYDFEVMERGGTLSVGQRQLISFARALVFNPDILILDEATSSIDTESETIIQNAIEKLIDNRTSIVIAHRLSTVRKANSILVMDQGIVSEFGDHNTLIANEHGIYRKLYDMQFNTVESV
jgi:ATP-binding cassette subfamily B protein